MPTSKPVDPAFGKKPPQALDIEAAVLGAIMLEKGAFDIASEILSTDAFYDLKHSQVYKAMVSIQLRNSHIDLLTVVEELRKMGELENVGGPFFVTKLTNAVVSTAHLEEHCQLIQEKFLAREMIRLGGDLLAKGFDDTQDAFGILDFAEERLFTLTTGNLKQNYDDAFTVGAQCLSEIEMLRSNPEDISGVPTGYKPLDKLTRGWQPTDLIILAARPSVGKTAFMLNLAKNAAMHHSRPTPVGIFSLEMSKKQLMHRLISCESEVGLEKILRGRIDDEELRRVAIATDRLASAKLFFDDTPALNVFDLRAKARRMVSRDKVGLIIIDYLQLMSGLKGDRNSNREQEISTISRSLKALAKELNVPIIALSQLSRQIESRKGGEPQLSDLRESGAIEQDADVVIFLTRPDYQQRTDAVDPMVKNDADIKIKKHRSGKLDDLAFKTDLSIQKWFDIQQFEDYQRESGFGSGYIPVSVADRRFSESVDDFDNDDEMPF